MNYRNLFVGIVVVVAFVLVYYNVSGSNPSEHTELKEGIASTAAETVTFNFDEYVQSNSPKSADQKSLEELFEEYRDIALSDQRIKDFHSSEENPFTVERAHVAHILIATRPEMTISERQAKYERALVIYRQAKQTGDFALLAEQHSDDLVTAKKGGDLGLIEKGMINQTFSDLVFEDLQLEQVSKPIQTRFGYHIVKLLDTPENQKRPLEEVRPFIKSYLEGQLHEEWQDVSANRVSHQS